MDRIIEVQVRGNYLSKDNKVAGVQHEGNVTFLRISFDEKWNTYAKTVTWWDALGQNPVKITLTTALLEDAAKSTLVYLCPIPPEPLAEDGYCTFVIDGYTDGKRQRSVSDTLEVKYAPFDENAGEPADPTPTQAEQLQAGIDAINETIHEAAVSAEEAATSATNAANSATTASVAATNALNSRMAAESSAAAAAGSADAAAASATAAATSDTNAANSATAADNSADEAKASETAAKASETAAKESETAAEESKNYAQTAAETAAVKSGNAALSEQNAAASASDAAASASAAQTAQAGAEAAQSAIENMSVEAITLTAGASATVTKGTDSAGNVKLTYGIPTGPQGPQGERGPQGPAGSGTGDMTASVYDPTGKAQDIFAYVDKAVGSIPTPDVSAQISAHNTDANAHSAQFSSKQDKITVSGLLKGDGAGGVSPAVAGTDYQTPLTTQDAETLGIDDTPTSGSNNLVRSGGVFSAVQNAKKPIATTAGLGGQYTATIDGITELTAGLEIVIIPHVASGSTAPKLNVNSLGEVEIRRCLSNDAGHIELASDYTGWLPAGVPISLMYNGSYWIIQNMSKPNADDLYGQLSVSKGGTGNTSLTRGSYLMGNDTNPVLTKTPVEVLEDIGAAAAIHNHDSRYYTETEVNNLLAAKAPAYTYGTEDLTAGTSTLETGKLYFVYE